MSHIKSKVDVEITMNQFLDDGIIDYDQYEELNLIILSIIEHPELKEYYNADLISYNEREIIQKTGGNLIPDRIVLNKDNKAIIIDYKSGAPNKYHKNQLNSYEKALKNMGYYTLKKLLLYIEEGTIKVENC